jgi:uncharacterized protein involved in exopolysaccharide biosynthesis
MSELNQMNNNCIEEDEIDLRELWQTILRGWKTIALITVVVVSMTLIYALKLPNVYKSEAILIPTEKSSGGLGGLGGLAAMAGVSIGGGGSMTPDVAFNTLLNDYDFMKNFVIKNKILEYYNDENIDKNYVFALGFRGIYDLFKSSPKEDEGEKDVEGDIYNIVKQIKGNFSISSDKKTALITVSYSDNDRNFPPKMVNAFLRDASDYLVANNLRIIDNKLNYFSKEMQRADGFELRQSLSSMISNILQEKVMMKSKVYYQCDVLTTPTPSYIRDKTKPKRGLIMVVSFITSIILGIFLVFFLEFIKGSKEEEQTT